MYHFSENPDIILPVQTFWNRQKEERKICGVTSMLVVQEITHRMRIEEVATVLPDIKTKELALTAAGTIPSTYIGFAKCVGTEEYGC